MKSWFHDSGIEMYLTRKERKSFTAERFIRTLRNKTYNHVTAASKNVRIERLDERFDKCNNAYKTIKMKPVHVSSGRYIEYGVEHNDKDPKFKVSNHVKVSKCKNIFAKGYTPNWFEEVSISVDIGSEEIVGAFNEKEL